MPFTNPSYTFTRPADTNAYASGDLVANSVTAGSVVPLQWMLGYSAVNAPVTIKRVRLFKSGTTITLSAFRLHIFGALPTVTNGDNGAWLASQSANYLAYFDITQQAATLLAFSDGGAGWGALAAGSEANVKFPAGAILYGLLEARAAYVPASAESFTAILELIE